MVARWFLVLKVEVRALIGLLIKTLKHYAEQE
jgi:hypothetical protein